jgi:ribosome-associated translation inhibitor RaiA
MRLVVHGHNVEITPELYSHVEGQVLSTLGTLGRQVGRVTVRIHAPAGAEDAMTACHILVELHPSGGLGIGDAAPNVETAIDRAAERAGGAVRRELARRRGLPDGRSLAYGLE